MPWTEVVMCSDPACADHGIRVARADEAVFQLTAARTPAAGQPARRKARRKAERKARRRSR